MANTPNALLRAGQLAEYRARCLEALETALGQAPFYRRWHSLDPGAAHSVDERYAVLPPITKTELREHFPLGFVTEGRDVQRSLESGEIELAQTSGTTEERATTIWCQPWWDASERASWTLNAAAMRAASGTHREAILTNPLSTGVMGGEDRLPMSRRQLGRFLYLNEMADTQNWDSDHMDRMAAELGMFRPAVLEANPTLLAKLARHIADKGRKVYQPGLIILTYEFPSRLHRRQIQRAFRCPVASSHGSTETGYVFMECEAGKFHQNSDYCRVDILPLRPEHGGPAVGRLLVTPFLNPWLALLRFDIGDVVRMEESGTCPCGRNHGVILSAIEGRSRDITLTPEGRAVTVNRLDEALSLVPGIVAYQLDQTAPDVYALRVVCGGADAEAARKDAADVLRELYGANARVTVELVPDILPEVSGKHRLARPMLPVDLDALAARPA